MPQVSQFSRNTRRSSVNIQRTTGNVELFAFCPFLKKSNLRHEIRSYGIYVVAATYSSRSYGIKDLVSRSYDFAFCKTQLRHNSRSFDSGKSQLRHICRSFDFFYVVASTLVKTFLDVAVRASVETCLYTVRREYRRRQIRSLTEVQNKYLLLNICRYQWEAMCILCFNFLFNTNTHCPRLICLTLNRIELHLV